MGLGLRRSLTEHKVLLGILLLAAIAHVPVYGDSLNPDTTTYMEVTRSLLTSGSFDIELTLVPHHPPLMSTFFAPFALLFGLTESAVHTFQLLILTLAVTLLYFVSLPILGRFAVIPALFLALDPVLYINMSEGRTLGLLIIFTLLTLWGVWRGLEDSRWMVVAAIGASFAFLTADSVGYLVIVAGAIGLAWRFYYKRWAVFRDTGYLAAIFLFLGVVLLWTAYNLLARGTPFTSPRVVGYLNRLFLETPIYIFAIFVGGFAVYFSIYVIQAAIPFLVFREGRKALLDLPGHAIRNQRLGALVLFIGVAVGISAILSAAFILYEPFRSFELADTYLRYSAVVVPLVYLAIGVHVRNVAARKSKWRWIIPVVIVVALLSAQTLLRVNQGNQNGAVLRLIEQELEARGYDTVYSDGAIYLRYNIPDVSFVSVDKGYTTRYVNITPEDVPWGEPLLTVIYVPPVYDGRIGPFYLVDRFDPNLHSPLLNLFYRD